MATVEGRQLSDVALIREWIDQEISALEIIKKGFAQVADHETISHHYSVIDVCYTELAAAIGAEPAIAEICERINQL